MYNMIKSDEDFKRAVLDLYSYINFLTCTESLDCVCDIADDAVACIEQIKVYRFSELAKSADFNVKE